MSSWCQPVCSRKRCVKVCIECCVCRCKEWYTVKIPIRPIAALATRVGNQSFTNAALPVIFNNVLLNEASPQSNGCGSCNRDPCCCKKKKKKCKSKKKCGCKSDPCSCKKKKKCCDSSSSDSDSSDCFDRCNPCNGWNNPCNPYNGGWGNMGGWCNFYDSNTGIATVPLGGAGSYVMTASITTDAINGFTFEIRVSGQIIGTQIVPPGSTSASLMINRELFDYQQISAIVHSTTPANVTGGNLSIARIA